MKSIYHRLKGLFKRKRRYSPAEIEKKLPAGVLAALKAEARFLRDAHGVTVSALEPGEKPGKPRAVTLPEA